MNNASALNCAAYAGSVKAVKTLLEIRADPLHINDNGGWLLTDVCQNKAVGTDMLDLVWHAIGGRIDINTPQRPRTRKWRTICLGFELALRMGLSTSALTRD